MKKPAEQRKSRLWSVLDCYAENGFTSVGVKTIAKACDCSVATLYQYFDNLDDLIVKSTEYCMSKVEDDFMAALMSFSYLRFPCGTVLV